MTVRLTRRRAVGLGERGLVELLLAAGGDGLVMGRPGVACHAEPVDVPAKNENISLYNFGPGIFSTIEHTLTHREKSTKDR